MNQEEATNLLKLADEIEASPLGSFYMPEFTIDYGYEGDDEDTLDDVMYSLNLQGFSAEYIDAFIKGFKDCGTAHCAAGKASALFNAKLNNVKAMSEFFGTTHSDMWKIVMEGWEMTAPQKAKQIRKLVKEYGYAV